MSLQHQSTVEIAPQSAAAFRIAAGCRLTVIDPCGEQVADLVAFAQNDCREVLSNGRTFDYNETIRLTAGNVLYSNRSRPMFAIESDDCGTHDFLLAPCSRDTWRLCYGDRADIRPGCFGNLARVLEPFGIEPDAVPTAFNVFMNVAVGPDGTLRVLPPRSRPGDRIVLEAAMDMVVGLTACSAPLSNNGTFKPIRYSIAPGID